jgi:hypothetical protein
MGNPDCGIHYAKTNIDTMGGQFFGGMTLDMMLDLRYVRHAQVEKYRADDWKLLGGTLSITTTPATLPTAPRPQHRRECRRLKDLHFCPRGAVRQTERNSIKAFV